MTDTKLTAALKLVPVKSQVFVLSLTVPGAVSVLGSMLFLANGLASWPIPLAVGFALIGLGYFAWIRSHRDVDLHGAHPFTVKDSSSGLELSADARAIEDQDARTMLACLVTRMAHREPLPQPDGLVDDSKIPIPNSRDEAIRRVQAINVDAETLDRESFKTIRNERDAPAIEQQPNPALPTELAQEPTMPRQVVAKEE